MADPTACSARLRLLAEPTRLSVVRLLAAGPRTAGEVAASLRVEQSLLSHHLALLRRARLVSSVSAGKQRIYCLAPGVHAPSSDGVNLGCCVLSFRT